MVYVISMDFYKKDPNTGQKTEFNLIKIGYTNNWVNRKRKYDTDNPGYKILYLYKDGTMELEKSLHRYFKDLLCNTLSAREWFWRNQSIIDFFESLPTKEDEFLGEFRKLRTIYDRLCYIRDYQFRGESERNRLLDLIGEPYKSLS